MGGSGSVPSIIAPRESRPAIVRPRAVLGPGSCQVTTRERDAPQSAATVSLCCAVMLSPSVLAHRTVIVHSTSIVIAVSHRLIILRAKLRLLCAGLDFVDRVVFARGEILDDKRQGGVDFFSDSIDARSLEDEIEPWPGGTPVCGFDDTLSLEFVHDPHLVVKVWCQRIGTSYGTFGNHAHVLFSYRGTLGPKFGQLTGTSPNRCYAAGAANSETCSCTQSLTEREALPVRSKTVDDGTAYTLSRVISSIPIRISTSSPGSPADCSTARCWASVRAWYSTRVSDAAET